MIAAILFSIALALYVGVQVALGFGAARFDDDARGRS